MDVKDSMEWVTIAPGVAIWRRQDWDSIRFLHGTPQIHLHYLRTDEEVDAAGGESIVELCCHGCGEAEFVIYKLPTVDQIKFVPSEGIPKLRALRDQFQIRHKSCPNVGYESLCPPDQRTKTVTIDLRNSV